MLWATQLNQHWILFEHLLSHDRRFLDLEIVCARCVPRGLACAPTGSGSWPSMHCASLHWFTPLPPPRSHRNPLAPIKPPLRISMLRNSIFDHWGFVEPVDPPAGHKPYTTMMHILHPRLPTSATLTTKHHRRLLTDENPHAQRDNLRDNTQLLIWLRRWRAEC